MIGVSPVGVIVIVPLYRLFGVIVKRDDEIFTVPNDGPVRVYVVAVASGGQISFPIIATINGQTLHNHYH